MNLSERIEIYREIEKLRDRQLVVYVTSTRPGVTAMMAGDSVHEFIDQIDAVEGV